MQISFILPVPTASPSSVSILDATFTTIAVKWSRVDCIHRNGNITGYSVRYGVQGSGSTQIVNISGGATTETTISGLTPSTSYSLAVAAVNSAGIGVYTDLLNVTTDSKYILYKCWM